MFNTASLFDAATDLFNQLNSNSNFKFWIYIIER